MPHLYIIAGCNGAGKTTSAYTTLPCLFDCHQFVNADEIARGLSPFAPESVAVEAGRIMLSRIQQLLVCGETFAIETTLATRSYATLVRKAQQRGYRVVLIFIYLSSPELAEKRVANRVAHGGHNIPREVIYRRYYAGLKNLFELFLPIVDEWYVSDNSEDFAPKIIITNSLINDPVIWKEIQNKVR